MMMMFSVSDSDTSCKMCDRCSNWLCQVPLAICVLAAVWLALKTWRRIREQQIRVIPARWNGIHAHQYSLIQCLSHRATCGLCRSLIVDAMLCDSCGICLDFQCYKRITHFWYSFTSLKRFSSRQNLNISTDPTPAAVAGTFWAPLVHCKQVAVSRTEAETSAMKWSHHWVHGNLPDDSKCFVCDLDCEYPNDGSNDGSERLENLKHTLYHYRCCWCQRTIDEDCFKREPDIVQGLCDFGRYRKFMMPPCCIIHKPIWTASRSKAIALEAILDFRSEEPDWSPLLVIANRKSGSNEAGQILSKFLSILNPLQVIDLSGQSNLLELSMQMCRMLPEGVPVRILVAGGDGTVAWVLNAIRQRLNDRPGDPMVAIFPLGTGNDLARVLGWDKLFDSCRLDCDAIIRDIYRARAIDLDRWSVSAKPIAYRRTYSMFMQSLRMSPLTIPVSQKDLFMYNYFSVGVDALVALNFHRTRKSKWYEFLFSNTFFNKFLYFTFGTKDLWERRCKRLDEKIRLRLDGQEVQLPELESIVVLNIQSWAGGVKLVRNGRSDDAKVEVLGLTSSFHIGQLMMGISRPIFLGRANSVRLYLMEQLPVQVDGEPWLQLPAQINISWNSHAKLLETVEHQQS